jgi:unsaturated chondroitin disaccharide hydrolase
MIGVNYFVCINNKYLLALIIAGFTLFFSCKQNDNNKVASSLEIEKDSLTKLLLKERYKKILAYPIDSLSLPRSYNQLNNTLRKVPSKDWVSGFFAGNNWFLYQLTGNDSYKTKAIAWTAFIEKEKFNDKTHDMGFKINCSFGNAYKFDKKKAYKNIIIQSAKTLLTRYNKKVASLRSWDHGSWEFPVIIDNMMNLELLFLATELSGDSIYYNVAHQHALTTLKNHFRKDLSSYHVVNYDTITGKVIAKETHQGFSDESSWARGQAWGLYGFTMCYRETDNVLFKIQAEKIAKFIMSHPQLPKDKIPYWDYNAPDIPNAPRDASAAAITASALYELRDYSTDSKAYTTFADAIISSLSSEKYIIEKHSKYPFILNHSTGNMPKNGEVDVPISYADYYYLEALIRKEKINKNNSKD